MKTNVGRVYYEMDETTSKTTTVPPWFVRGDNIDSILNPVALMAPKTLNPQTEGDRHLIAAAPDLYEALKASRAYREDEPTPWGHDCRWCEECINRVVALQEAAIAKAEGRTS